jgi:hypothetical protein
MGWFWKWFDRGARVDFAFTLARYLPAFWVALVGGVGTFVSAAIVGRSPLDVWVMAAVVAASFAVVVFIVIAIFEKLAKWVPRIHCSFDPSDPGCVRPNTTLRRSNLPRAFSSSAPTYSRSEPRKVRIEGYILASLESATTLQPTTSAIAQLQTPGTTGTYYRVKAVAKGRDFSGCKGRLVSLQKESRSLIGGETIDLPFARAEAPDATSKTLHRDEPEHLDFLFISDANDVELTPKEFKGPSSIPWGTLFAEPGVYQLQIKILSSEAAPASINLTFNWTGNRETSTIVQTSP